jgi:hypothetical protein
MCLTLFHAYPYCYWLFREPITPSLHTHITFSMTDLLYYTDDGGSMFPRNIIEYLQGTNRKNKTLVGGQY